MPCHGRVELAPAAREIGLHVPIARHAAGLDGRPDQDRNGAGLTGPAVHGGLSPRQRADA